MAKKGQKPTVPALQKQIRTLQSMFKRQVAANDAQREQTARGHLESVQRISQEYETRLKRLGDQITQYTLVVADKDKAIAARDEELTRRSNAIAAITAERDRIVRIVDQFTSISIGSLVNTNVAQLRRT